MRKLLIFSGVLVLQFVAGTTNAAPYAPSAVRAQGQSADDLYYSNLAQILTRPSAAMDAGQVAPTISQSAYAAKKALSEIKIEQLPEVASYEDLVKEFEYIRDTRFMTNERLEFHRRLSWLYPDDGCYVRADLASYFAQAKSYPKPKKLFAFGNLTVETKNASGGRVGWWYHVVIAYRVGLVGYVIDPAIEPQRPLKISDWGARMGLSDQNPVDFSVCEASAFHPYSDCKYAYQTDFEENESSQISFLRYEYDRLTILGRNPKEELGDNPPWKTATNVVVNPQPAQQKKPVGTPEIPVH